MAEAVKLKVGIVGVGALGRHHTRIYKTIPNVEIIGIYDVSSEAVKKVSSEFQVTPYFSLEELAEKCDALSIAVPANLHYELAIPLLKAGKHLLIEKPIATKINHARKIVELAEKKNLVVCVGHVECYNPSLDYVEHNVKNIRFIEIQRLAPYPPPRSGLHRRGTEVGVVLDLMIHDIDIVLRLVNSPIERIEAVGMCVFSRDEDIANARIKFKNGCVANLTASRISQEYQRRMRFFQTDSYISIDLGKKSGMIFRKEPDNIGIIKEQMPVPQWDALEKEIADFVNCALETVRTGKSSKPKVSGRDGLESLEVAVKIASKSMAYSKKYRHRN